MAAAGPDPAPLRREYGRGGLRRDDLADDPLEQFRLWFAHARRAGLLEPNAMVLGTCDGAPPSSRTVLLKAFDRRDFAFFSHDRSRKAREIAAQPQVSLAVPLVRAGAAGGGPGAGDTHQPGGVAGLLRLPARRQSARRLGVAAEPGALHPRSAGGGAAGHGRTSSPRGPCPSPPSWGGFRVEPLEIPFWQGRRNRLHDRFRYRRQDVEGAEPGGWIIERLAP